MRLHRIDKTKTVEADDTYTWQGDQHKHAKPFLYFYEAVLNRRFALGMASKTPDGDIFRSVSVRTFRSKCEAQEICARLQRGLDDTG